MKKNFLFALMVMTCVINIALSQTKPKSKQAQTAPTQKELEALMKEAQQEMDNLDPETKRMMDSMGIKMPSFDQMPKMTDAQLQQAYADANRIVPVKDAARIASIAKTPLTNASLPAYVSNAHSQVVKELKPASKTKGEELYQSLKAQYNSATATGNAATALWMIGKAELALYVMGKACMENPTQTDNLNNYAAMLSMGGAPQLSIPLLGYVNKRFKKNSTVLNNIGQAWFGLGDINKASAYLDSAIRLFPNHPQANFTKSFIEESRNNENAAIEAVKRSIKKAHSMEKQERLNQLGYDLKSDDLSWNRPMPQDPLGLEKFTWPAYPQDVFSSEKLEKEWDIFKDACEQEMEVLRTQQATLEKEKATATEQRMRLLLQASKKGIPVSALPPLAPKAMLKLQHLVQDKDGHTLYAMQSKQQAWLDATSRVDAMRDQYAERVEKLDKSYQDLFGEGKANPFEKACQDENDINDSFLKAANTLLEQTALDYLNFLRRKLNDEVYYAQYTQWPDEFELTKVNAKLTWLGWIHGQKVMFKSKSKYCRPLAPQAPKAFKLAAFDDVHCMYHSELVTPVGTIKTDCSRVTTTLDLKLVKLGLKQDMEKETFGDQFMTCSVEVGVGTGAGFNAGPLKAEASIGAGISAEFDRSGLTDLVLKTSASVVGGSDIVSDGSMAGVGVSDLSLEVGVKGQISLISGKSSVESTGILDGVFKK